MYIYEHGVFPQNEKKKTFNLMMLIKSLNAHFICSKKFPFPGHYTMEIIKDLCKGY